MQAIRHAVSRDRRRYQHHDFDLDLTCILGGLLLLFEFIVTDVGWLAV